MPSTKAVIEKQQIKTKSVRGITTQNKIMKNEPFGVLLSSVSDSMKMKHWIYRLNI